MLSDFANVLAPIVILAVYVGIITVWNSQWVDDWVEKAANKRLASKYDQLDQVKRLNDGQRSSYREVALVLEKEALRGNFIRNLVIWMIVVGAYAAFFLSIALVPESQSGVELIATVIALFGGLPILAWIAWLLIKRFTTVGSSGSDGLVFQAFIEALQSLENCDGWGTRKGVVELVPKFEAVAGALRSHLRHLPVGDAMTEAWLSREAELVVAAARERKRLLYMPAESNRQQLQADISKDLLCLMRRDWSGLAKVTEVEQVRTRFESIKARVPPLMTAIAVGGGYWLMTEEFPFLSEGQAGAYFGISIIAIALLLLCKALYPGLLSDLERVSSIRKLISKG